MATKQPTNQQIPPPTTNQQPTTTTTTTNQPTKENFFSRGLDTVIDRFAPDTERFVSQGNNTKYIHKRNIEKTLEPLEKKKLSATFDYDETERKWKTEVSDITDDNNHILINKDYMTTLAAKSQAGGKCKRKRTRQRKKNQKKRKSRRR